MKSHCWTLKNRLGLDTKVVGINKGESGKAKDEGVTINNIKDGGTKDLVEFGPPHKDWFGSEKAYGRIKEVIREHNTISTSSNELGSYIKRLSTGSTYHSKRWKTLGREKGLAHLFRNKWDSQNVNISPTVGEIAKED